MILKEAQLSAESIKKDRVLEAKEKYLKLKSEFEEESNRKKNQIITNENKLKQRESNLSKQIELLWLADGDHTLKPRKRSGLTLEQHVTTAIDRAMQFLRDA